MPATSTQLVFWNFRDPCEVALEAHFERAVAVNRDRKPDDSSRPTVDVVAAIDPQQFPTVALNQARKVATRQHLHTAISRMRSFPPVLGSATFTDKHPSIASYRFCNSSSKVSP